MNEQAPATSHRPPASQARRGPVGARLPRAPERQRAVQEGRRRRSTSAPASRTSTPSAASPRSTPTTCAAGCAGGASTPSAPRASTAARPPPWTPPSSTPSSSCSGSAPTARSSAPSSCAPSARSPRRTPANTADITDRNNIQYHWIQIEDVPAIWERLEGVGLDSQEACGDSPRPFLGSPVAGIAKDEIIDGSPALAEIKRRFIGNPDFSNLPRKFKTALTGHPSHDVAPEVNDVSFVGTVHPEHGAGFDLWVGGGLSTNPMLAQKLGVWIPIDEVADAWEGVASIFRDYGYRRLRSRARLKFLVADWGVEKFREVLETEYLHRTLVDNPSPVSPEREGDHIGVHEQKDGNFYIGAAPVVGRVDGTTLTALADLVERYGAQGARLTAYQKLVVIGVTRRGRRGVRRGPRADRPDRAPVQLAAQHDGLHRHRVLQARDRRHQGPRQGAGRRARAALPGPRRPDHGQRQRLPERLRPHPGRRHRPQGHAGDGRRRQPGRGVPGAPGWRPRAHRRTSAASCAPTR